MFLSSRTKDRINGFAMQKLLRVQGFKSNSSLWYVHTVAIYTGRQISSGQEHQYWNSAHTDLLSCVVWVLGFGFIYLLLEEELTVPSTKF